MHKNCNPTINIYNLDLDCEYCNLSYGITEMSGCGASGRHAGMSATTSSISECLLMEEHSVLVRLRRLC